ncbi:MAG: DUF2339 domain-containing protein [Desulfobulbaceae bacterium]
MGNHVENSAFSADQLMQEIQRLADRVEQLSARLTAIEHGTPSASPRQAAAPVAAPRAVQAHAGPPSLIDTSALLPRIATICFLLVIALILRTVTDNQFINIRIGSILGMTYAAILILLGFRLYAGKSRLAPVFPGCGILLLFSIVLETHAHYHSLSTLGAYGILFAGGASIFAMSIRYRASTLICLGVPGTAAVAMAIDFPYPSYPVLGTLLLAAIVAASYAFKQQMCRYLRWFILVLSALFWLLWTSKMDTIPACAEPVAEAMSPGWFLPMLLAFWVVYLTTVVLNVLKKDLQLGVFESIIPTVTAVGGFTAANIAVTSWLGGRYWLYVAAAGIATLHLALAWWLARHNREKATGANVFILAGACLIITTSAVIMRKNIGYALPVWSASALLLAYLSAAWRNQGIRLTSYFMQALTCAVAISSGTLSPPFSQPLATALAAAGLGVFGLSQYRWSRHHPPDPTHSFFFARIDRKDYLAAVLLVCGLLGSYGLGQVVLEHILAGLSTDFNFRFQSGQSLLINSGALVLMYLALKGRNRELIVIATIVALIGAGKVFILDLFGIKGVPLVLSVFSTGVVAAFGSVVMGRWQKKEAETA